MKYEWNSQKNEWLKEHRHISFEEIVFHLSMGNVWKKGEHPDKINYPGQEIYFAVIDEYIYLVPHVVDREYIFLKTIIPSRKATKLFLKERKGIHEIR